MTTTLSQKAFDTAVSIAPAATLATATGYISSAQGADATGGDLLCDAELTTAFGSAPTAGLTIDLYLLPASDGTNYPYGGTAQIPSSAQYKGSFICINSASSTNFVIEKIPFPTGLYKVLLWNVSGQTMSSGWTLTLRPLNYLST